mmetsp:Transcript_91108/g.281786  ORF Transcript_91108/g.281786 Transcript_91108/m.281786 type:complete len:204 (+) Transcript_91108:1444-2055(+)
MLPQEGLHILADGLQVCKCAGVVIREPDTMVLVHKALVGVRPLRAEVVHLVVPGVSGSKELLHLFHGVSELLLQKLLRGEAHRNDVRGDVGKVQVDAVPLVDEAPLLLGHTVLAEGAEGFEGTVEAPGVKTRKAAAEEHDQPRVLAACIVCAGKRGHKVHVRDQHEEQRVEVVLLLLRGDAQAVVYQVPQDQDLVPRVPGSPQ